MRTHHVRKLHLICLRHYLYMANTETELTETSLQQRLKRETTAVSTSRPSSGCSIPASTCTDISASSRRSTASTSPSRPP